MRRFKLKNSLTISDLADGRTVHTETMPYVYLNVNGIYFSPIRTNNPVKAFNESASQLYFLNLDNAAMAFSAIKRAAKSGCDISYREHDEGDMIFQFSHLEQQVNSSAMS
jgi:hypothetical protein